MSDITPGRSVTCTITKTPQRVPHHKTLSRLMNMQPHIQKGLRKLAVRRRLHDNHLYTRAGRPWVDRKRTTKLTRVELGETFTLHVTPQIVADLRSVEKYLKISG